MLPTLGNLRVQMEDIQFEEVLGKGGYAQVFRGVLKDTKEKVALKQLEMETTLLEHILRFQDFARESEILLRTDHPNIVQLKGISFFRS